jgi:hypothetical protein
VERALDAYQMARGIVDDGEAERIDLAGAMVLLRQAGREIAEVKLHKSTKRGTEARKSGAARASASTKSAKTRGLPAEPVHGQSAPRGGTDRTGW